MNEPPICNDMTAKAHHFKIVGPHGEQFELRRNVIHKCHLTEHSVSVFHWCECSVRWDSDE